MDMIPVHVGDLVEHYPDLPVWVIETLLSKRSDLNKIQLKEAIESCTRIIEAKQEQHATSLPETVSILLLLFSYSSFVFTFSFFFILRPLLQR